MATPSVHLRGQGCPKCGKEKQKITVETKSKEEIFAFLEKAEIIHNNKYDYSLVEYINTINKIKIICNEHGPFWQTPQNHLSGRGCKLCGLKNKTKTSEDFIKEAKNIHGEKFDYSLVEYLSADIKIIIICKIHGQFYQTPDSHLRSQYCCYECSRIEFGFKMRNDTDHFIEKANEIHKNKYDYSATIYSTNRDKVIIGCPKHGIFEQQAGSHLAGGGCKKCTKSVSNKEVEWLDSLGVKPEYRNLTLKFGDTVIKPDGYDPGTNTIYEFYGDFWHGNPMYYDFDEINVMNKTKFGQLFINTLKREEKLKNNGYKLITIWQSEWVSGFPKLTI